MNLRVLPLLLSCATLLCLAAASAAQSINSQIQSDDPRLKTAVSATSTRIYLGELLESLTEQSKVQIYASDEDRTAGEELVVSLKQVPAVDVLNALQTLLSYRGATWFWVREKGDDGTWRYRLKRPKSANNLAANVKDEVSDSFRRHVNALISGSTVVDGESSSGTEPDELTKKYLSASRIRTGITLFAQLPQEVRDKVLQSDQSVKIPVSALPDAAKSLARSLPDGDTAEAITFDINSTTGEVAPTLFILLDGEGYGYAGGRAFEALWGSKIQQGWTNTRDELAHKDEGKVVATRSSPGDEDTLTRQLIGLSRATAIPIIGRNSQTLRDAGAVAVTKNATLKTFLEQLSDSAPHIMHKWRNSVLLLTPRDFVLQETLEKRVKWGVVKRLRAACQVPADKVLPLPEVMLAGTALTSSTFAYAMQSEFAASPSIGTWFTFLAWLGAEPSRQDRVMSERGLAVSTALRNSLRGILERRDPDTFQRMLQGRIATVRLTTKDNIGVSRSGSLEVMKTQDKIIQPPLRRDVYLSMTDIGGTTARIKVFSYGSLVKPVDIQEGKNQ